jgi:Ca-activated chloride channel family protein
MKTNRFAALVLFLCLLGLAFPAPARADGIIIPEPPICIDCPPQPLPIAQLHIRYHRVQVTIDNQVATTRVDQVFYNPNSWQVEGMYVFPLPPEAAVASFVLWIDGKPVEGQVLDAEEARRTYEDIVRRMQDPALLEYAGRGALQARIFPIPPGGERRIELEYSQALTAENGLVRYTYPLNTEKFSTQPLEQVSVSVDVRARSPIRAVYSPSHEVEISRLDNNHVRAGYEADNVRPDTDFSLYYSLGESQAFHLLSYRDPTDPGDADGFFLVLLAPSPQAEVGRVPKDVLLVLDRSGSMDGEKFQQAQQALRYILQNLNPEDRFNLITFSTGVELYASRLRPAEEANEALAWVDRLSAQGSTDIHRALLEAAALVEAERPAYLIFLTDGLPTEGVTDSQKIVDDFAQAAPRNLRLFAFGVGYDVDTFLLDSLAQAHHGASTYVVPGEPLDEVLSAFYTRISSPVLTDLALDFGGLAIYDLYPQPLPDLFLGSQILAVGRYRQGGAYDVTLRGMVENQEQVYRFPDQVFSQSSAGVSGPLTSLPRLWATRKIGYLLNQVRLNGPNQELIDQIVRLSIRYGIVTPYTSYLVTEEVPLGAAAQEQIVERELQQLSAAPQAPSSGEAAVNKAADQANMAQAESAYAPQAGAAETVRIVGARTFVNRDGVWIDTAYDPESMDVQRVAFLSPDYFSLAAMPELGAAFALGRRVIAVSGGQVYEVVAAEEQAPPVQIPPTTAPTAVKPAATLQPVDLPAPGSLPAEPGATAGQPCLGGLLLISLGWVIAWIAWRCWLG